MPYLSAPEVKAIRENLKKEFPAFRFSVTRSNHSGVCVTILEAPLNMLISEKEYAQVNTFYIADNYKEHPEVRDILLKVHQIMNDGNKIISEDGDYGSIPKFYTTLKVGDYDKPFKVVEREDNAQPKIEAQEVKAGKVQIIEYSERAIAVIGDTKPIKDKLKELGGKFNFRLSCGAGWIFRKADLEKVKEALNPTTLKEEIQKTIEFSAETDKKIYGFVTPSTMEIVRVQKTNLPNHV